MEKPNQRVGNQRLSMKHLSSAIVMLIIGCAHSTVVFITENISVFRFRRSVRATNYKAI